MVLFLSHKQKASWFSLEASAAKLQKGGSWRCAFAGSVVHVKLNDKENEKRCLPFVEWIASLFVLCPSLEVERSKDTQPDRDDLP